MYSAKSAVPIAGIPYLRCPAINRAIERPITLFYAPAGYMPTEYLSTVLMEHGRSIIWLRFGVEDRDPATCLRSLINAAQFLDRQIGQETQKRMKQYPGGIYGWAALFELLTQEYLEILPPDCTIVLDGIHQLGQNQPVVYLLMSHFLVLLSQARSCILITQSKLRTKIPLSYSDVIGIRELQLNPVTLLELNNVNNDKLSKECIHSLIEIGQGRLVAIQGILQACHEIGSQCIEDAIKRSKSLEHMLVLVARNCLLPTNPSELQALVLTLETGYFRNDIYREALGKTVTVDGPWLQSLQDGWSRVHGVWNRPLKLVLHNYVDTRLGYLCKLASTLSQRNAFEIAVPLLIKAEKYDQAAQIIEERVDELMSYGQWELLNSWLREIPRSVLEAYPWITYAQGEIHSIYGCADDTQHTFLQVGNNFSNHGEVTCRSLLAESVLRARKGDRKGAYRNAHSAYFLSKSSNMNRVQGWACYQLGILACEDNEYSLAQDYFTEAIRLIGDPFTCDWIQKIKDVIKVQENHKEQCETYARLLKKTEHLQQKTSEQLSELLHSTPDALPKMLNENGWLGIPLALKLPFPNKDDTANETPIFDKVGVWMQRIRNGRESLRQSPTDTALSPLDSVVPISLTMEKTRTQEQDETFPASKHGYSIVHRKSSEAQLMIYSLGSLQVLRDRQFVSSWPSHKAQLIFKYLLLHRHSLVPKETIMETFWPEADLESARRSLHQAIYTLRQTLKCIAHDMHFIEFENEGYRINPSINIWLDFEAFEGHCISGQSKEHSGYIEQAMAEYSLAEELYQDHLFSDDLYEDWIQPYRQYYWQLYLSSAAQLANSHYEKRDYSTAISIAQRILHKDRCQEFAYQILMRCFHGQGQRQLALHQYELCRQSLMEELEVEPSGKTTQLFLEILNE